MPKILSPIAIFLLIALLLPTTLLLVPAQDVKANGGLSNVYVNGTTGNDNDYDGSSPVHTTGSIGPKRTITAGITIVASSGTVNVAAGTYYEYGIDLDDDMSLVGDGALTTIIDGGAQGCVLRVSSMPTQENTISGFTIQNGAAAFGVPGDFGGGIYISSAHIVTINDCAIINNTKLASIDHEANWGVGAGICNDGGTLYMNRCTVSGNTALFSGGGIYTKVSGGFPSGLVELTNCTISGNTVTTNGGIGGGIYSQDDTIIRLVNVTIANNQATGTGSYGGGFANISDSIPPVGNYYFKNCIVSSNTAGDGIHNNGYDTYSGVRIHTQGYNIDSENSCFFNDATDQINTNPLLGVLQNNGGPTSTHAITASSPAFNTGTSDGAPATDQRGVTRPQGATCDIGAFELVYSVDAATGMGTATFTTSSGSLTSLTASASTPCGTSPGPIFPYGFFSFTIDAVTPGSPVTITIILPTNIPAGAQYWKCINGSWVNVTSLLSDNDGDNVLTLTITDGQLGDADGQANGSISDPGGPAILVVTPSSPAAQPASKPKPFAESSSAPEQFIPSSAKLSVKYLNVQPQQAQANQPVTVYANIANGGDESSSYTATLKINGMVEETRTGRVSGRAAVPLKFEVLRDKPGIYNVDINGQKASFIIVDDGGNKFAPTQDWVLIGFVICAMGVVVVSVLLIQRRRNA